MSKQVVGKGNDDDLHWVMSQWFPCIPELPCIVIFLVAAQDFRGEGVACLASGMSHASNFFRR